MSQILYGYSLYTALTLMLFFGFYFIAARKPDNPVFSNYIRSRRIMGVALLILSANYAAHLVFKLRFTAPGAAILINLATYYISSWLFSSALTSLLDRQYLTRKRFLLHIASWLCYVAAAGAVSVIPPGHPVRTAGIIVMTLWFLVYAFSLAARLIRAYRHAVRLFDETQSDHISAYIDWFSVFTWWAVIYGVGCGIFTFIPENYVFLWVLSSIPFYIYLYCSYMNYILFYEKVETALEIEMPMIEEDAVADLREEKPQFYAEVEKNLAAWIEKKEFTRTGLTIEDVSRAIGTNRTYLSEYIKTTYNASFREWITSLKLEFARQMISAHPEMTIGSISEVSGFLSRSHFSKAFTEKEGITPAKWRRIQQ